MNERRYKIVFDGTLLPGVDVTTAKLNLAELFKCDVSAIDRLFTGKPITLKRDVSHTEAQTYLTALSRTGIKARLEPDPMPEPSLEKVKTVTPAPDDESPYSPPRSAVGETLPEFGELNIFGVQGRIGRLRFLAWMLVVVLVASSLSSVIFLIIFSADLLIPGILLLFALTLAFLYASITITVQRLHDLDWSGWLCFLYVAPVIGSILPLLLAALPGTPGPNRYGAPAPPNSLAVKALCGVWLGLVALGVIGIIAGGLAALRHEYEYSAAARPAEPDTEAQAAQPPVDYEKE
ncbi:DUF805 domain-containing protein [Pseudomonas purpurea]|uniref:DUF805 domain-containing protein n=1 Tax=Pseudomonas purpurea TaxID=3136737 RepID=UPI003265B735